MPFAKMAAGGRSPQVESPEFEVGLPNIQVGIPRRWDMVRIG